MSELVELKKGKFKMKKINNIFYQILFASLVILICSLVVSPSMIFANVGNRQNDTKEMNQENVDIQRKELDAQQLFEESLNLLNPLSHKQVKEYKEFSNKNEQAIAPVEPSLRARTVRVSLEPGSKSVRVNTTANIATALVFHDATGASWKITSITNGAENLFQVLRPEVPEGNLLNVLPLQSNASSTIIVTLESKDIPLVIALNSDSIKGKKRNADSMVLIQLAHIGPQGAIPVIAKVEDPVSSAMLSFLDQVPPEGAKLLKFTPRVQSFKVWEFEGKYFIRTQDSLIWPAWIASVNGASSIKCYEIMPSSKILLSISGKIHNFQMEQN